MLQLVPSPAPVAKFTRLTCRREKPKIWVIERPFELVVTRLAVHAHILGFSLRQVNRVNLATTEK